MTATAAMRTILRRMIAEPTIATYSDNALDDYIEAGPLHDDEGNASGDSGWTAVYDLNAAAADIWLEKAAGLTEDTYDVQVREEDVAAGGDYNTLWEGRSEIGRHALRMNRHYAARRAISTVAVTPLDDED